ncbi:MAG TPA: cation transporter [Allosphingosinicella sp.]|nr:cation transporter [Allosphingosinicella sp.]
MSQSCCEPGVSPALADPRWRRALWVALGVNILMFAVEIVAGLAGDSKALQADALDFLGDSANYAISLGVAGLALAWRARAALVKGITITLFGLYVAASALWSAFGASSPRPEIMGIVGIVALIANAGVALMLYRFRNGDSNMRSVWICSRNDAIGNVAVMVAAAGVLGTGSAWPDLIVAAIMATLAITGGIQIVAQALGELSATATEARS